MARRGAGEGSIYKRKDGLWAGDVQVGVGENGKRLRRTVYAPTQAKVLEKLDELRQRAAAGPWVDAGAMKLGEYLDLWLRGAEVRLRTMEYYKRSLRPVRATLGGVRLRSLLSLHVEALLGQMKDAGASARARQMTFAVLHAALAAAVAKRLLPSNPLRRGVASRPQAPKREIQVLDAAQVRALLAAAVGDPLEALYVVAVSTGLRLGELAGLQWRDVDLAKGRVSVRRALVESEKGARTVAEPKTSKAVRSVNLRPGAIAALRRHREALGALPHPDLLVFTSPEGEPLRRSNLHRRSYKPLLARAKLPAVPFHALRHSAASLALSGGASVKAVQTMLGHSSPTLTLNTYIHSMPDDGEAAAAAIDAAIYSQATAAPGEIRVRTETPGAANPAILQHAGTH